MKIKTKTAIKTATLSTLLAISSNTLASNHQDCGAYADILVGYGRPSVQYKGVDWNSDGFAGKINLGYQFTRHLAVEISGTKYPPFSESAYSLGGYAKFVLPIESQCTDVFFKAGVEVINTNKTFKEEYLEQGVGYYNYHLNEETKNGEILGSVAVGGTYWMNEKIGITAVATYGTTSLKDTDDRTSTISALAGVSFRI